MMIRLPRRVVLGLALLGLFAGSNAVVARGVSAEPIQRLNDALVRVMRAGREVPFQQRFDMLDPVISQVFDLQGILRVSVGLSWDGISPDQRAALMTAFRRFTVATYVANFDSYNGQQFEVSPAVRRSGQDEIVSTTLISGSGEQHRIDYVMRQVGGAWKASDVLLDGTISRVAVQRSDFRSLLNRGGAAALIASLQTKVASLSNNALAS
jgi:phospholipid transport system substrate-binding protein